MHNRGRKTKKSRKTNSSGARPVGNRKSFIHRSMNRFPKVQKGQELVWFRREFIVGPGTASPSNLRFNCNDLYRPQVGVSVSMIGFTPYGVFYDQFSVWATGARADCISQDNSALNTGICFTSDDPGTAPAAATLANRNFTTKAISGNAGMGKSSFSVQKLIEDIIGTNACYTADSYRGNFSGVSPADLVWLGLFNELLPGAAALTTGPAWKLTLSMLALCYSARILTN